MDYVRRDLRVACELVAVWAVTLGRLSRGCAEPTSRVGVEAERELSPSHKEGNVVAISGKCADRTAPSHARCPAAVAWPRDVEAAAASLDPLPGLNEVDGGT